MVKNHLEDFSPLPRARTEMGVSLKFFLKGGSGFFHNSPSVLVSCVSPIVLGHCFPVPFMGLANTENGFCSAAH